MSTKPSSRKLLCPKCGEIYEKGERETCPDDGSTLSEFVVDDEPDSDPLIGEVLDDRFEIDDVLGEGSMGRVYRATQRSVDRTVALKTVRPALSTDESIVKRFHREAQAISEFSHPNIVKLVDFGQDLDRGILYLAMEYIDGYPVERLLGRGRLEPALAIHLAIQICGALAAVHSEGLVHRDLKPENLMVVPLADGRLEVKLLDFGIAHELKRSQSLTKTGAVFGTPHYLSPEQAEAEKVGPYSDIYCLGAVLFSMLTGRRPVDAEEPMEVMVGHIEGRVPQLVDVLGPSAVSDHLNWLVDNMMATDPGDRPEDILRIRDVLRTIASLEEHPTPDVDPSLSDAEMFEPFVLEPIEGADARDRPDSAGGSDDGGTEETSSETLPADGEAADANDLPAPGPSSPPSETSPPPSDATAPPPGKDEPDPADETPGGSSSPDSSTAADADVSKFDGGIDEPEQSENSHYLFAVVVVLVLGVVLAVYFGFGLGDNSDPEAGAAAEDPPSATSEEPAGSAEGE